MAASTPDRGTDGSAAGGADGLLVARDVELAAVHRLVDDVPGDGRALVLEGAPGVGKTSLWERGVAGARERGLRVLVARASEALTGLSHAGLIDLLDEVDTEELEALPPPQLRALEVALYRADPTDRAPEPAVISLAVLSALRVLAQRGPLLVALDDVQWLDPTSEEALGYAARRLQQHPVRFLLARRPGRRSSLERAFAEDRTERVEVLPFTLGGTRQLLAARLGLRLPHHLLRRVHEVTTGNPLFALEVGRLLAGRDLEGVGADLPVPEDVEELLGLRVADLDDATGRLLLALALDADLRVAQVGALVGAEALPRAADAGLVVVDGERVRPAHPLMAAAAQRQASGSDVADLHRALADVAVDEHRRALHLALAATAPDAALAERLDAEATRAAARGATRQAIDLAGHAWRLTPDGDPAVDRLLALARHLHDAGEKQRLTDLLGDRVASLPPGGPRVTAYTLLTEGVVEGNAEILALLEKALAEAGEDPLLRGQVLCHLAENEAVIEVRGIERADHRAVEAVVLSDHGSADDRRLAINTYTWTQALRGRPVEDLVQRYLELTPEGTYLARHPQRVLGQRLVWRGEVTAARPLLLAFREHSEEWAEAYALARLHLCELELRAGGWTLAHELLDEWADSTDGDLLNWPMYERCRALLAVGRGDVVAAREWADRAVALADQTGVRWDWLEATRARGVAAILAKDTAAAVADLSAVWDHTQREGVLDPGAFPAASDLVEALLEHDDTAAARTVTGRLSELAEDQGHPWARASSRRSAALVDVAAAGYDERHGVELDAVAAEYRGLGLRFDEARTLLALGRAQRRAKKWGAGREVLERAVAAFESMGAPGWAADARAELDRVGARRPTSEGGLTTTERRVADLAVEGLSNKEIARTLVVTVNTVEFHLRNTYAKLGIRSRVQLAAALEELDAPSPEAG